MSKKTKTSLRIKLYTFYSIIISTAVVFGFNNCSPVHNIIGETGTHYSSTPQRPYYTCNQSQLGRTSSQRLSKREYENTMKDLLALVSSGVYDSTVQNYINNLPNDEISGKENTNLVYQTHIDNYFDIAYYVGNRIANNYIGNIPGTNGCLSNSNPNDSCVTNFINGFGSKVYRRPLTTAEVNRYKGYYNTSSFSTKQQKVTAVIATMLQSPDFLYRIYDQGQSESQFSNTRKLTDYELASKLSYLITGTMPDATLFNKAQNGTLSTEEGLMEEIDRLFQKPSAKTTLNRFFLEWLRYNQFADVNAFPNTVTNGLNLSNLSTYMTSEIQDTISYVVFNQNGTYEDLMTTRESFVYGSNLASIYGISNPNGRVTLDETRSGILSRAAFLARKASNLTSPSRRGHFILSDILCEAVGTPPPGAPTQVDPLVPGEFLTTRDRNHYLTIETRSGQVVTSCVSCHSRMNPFGYTYEAFDPLGRYRNGIEVVTGVVNGTTVNQQLPLNVSAETRELNGYNEVIVNHQHLHTKLGQSGKALSCMTEKWFEFVQKRAPSSDDYCYMNEVLATVYGDETTGQGSIKDMVKRTVLSPRFRYWKY